MTRDTSISAVAAALTWRQVRRPYFFALFSVHSFFVAYSMSIVEIPRALKGEPEWIVGFVVGVFGIAGMLTRPLTGVWVDRGGSRQRWVRLGAVGVALSFAGYMLDLGPWVMVIFRCVQGVAMGVFTTAMLAIVGNMLPPERRGSGLGFYQAANAAAALYGAALAVFVIDRFGFGPAFLLSGGTALLALVLALGTGDPAAPPPRVAGTPGRGLHGLISPTAMLPALVFACVTTPWGTITAFLPLFALERDLGNVGLFYTAAGLAQLTARVSAGWIGDRIGRDLVVVPALGAAGISLIVLSQVQSPVVLILCALAFGFGLAATQTSIAVIVIERTPPAILGSGMATYTMAWDVGQVVGAILLGLLVDATSYSLVFALTALFPVAGVVLFLTRVSERTAKATVEG
ncbi:MAG: MFS transporter [Dehalococcoidia bacterium]|nr:MAG: MFS transporter [Dehalococcoidia bacterium]